MPVAQRPWIRRLTSRPMAFWLVFLAIHVAMGTSEYYRSTYGDVFWYQTQIRKAFVTGVWPGIDTTFVYPGGSLPVMLLPAIFGSALYFTMWMVMVTVLNAVAALALLGWNPNNTRRLWLAWWWAAFIGLLGPVALGRVDSVSVPIVIIALTWLWRRPFLSGILLAFAGWIKIWPVAVFGALFVTLRRRWTITLGAVVFTVGLIAIYLAFGAKFSTIFGFITSQNNRGIQAEAVAATPFLWIAALGGKAGIVWNPQLLTNEIYGDGSTAVGTILAPLMVIVTVALCAIAFLARARGARIRRILPALMLGIVLTLIVFNKVGSPQFMTWLAAPVIVGLAMQQRRFDIPARYALIIALLTQLIYPLFYVLLLWLNPALVAIITIRNGLLVFLLGWSGLQLVSAYREAARGHTWMIIDRYSTTPNTSLREFASRVSPRRGRAAEGQ